MLRYDTVAGAFECTSVRLVEHGPVRAAIRVESRFGNSTLTEDVVLGATAPFVEVRSILDWREQLRMLKLRVPTSVQADRATFEVPYGHLERAANGDEQPAQAWVDVSDGRAGLSVVNDSKYGHDVQGGDIGITAARSPVYAWHHPRELDDLTGRYEYLDQAVRSSRTDWCRMRATGGTQDRAHRGGAQPAAVHADRVTTGELPPNGSFVSDGGGDVVVTVVKKSEDDAIVVRAYDSSGRRAGHDRAAARRTHYRGRLRAGRDQDVSSALRPEVAVDGDRPARVVSSFDGDEWRLRANARPWREPAKNLIELPANQLPRFYRGGARIAAFRGLESVDDQAPEDWVASTTVVHGDSQFGLSRLPDGGRLRDAIEADPEAFLGHAHVERFGADPALLVKLLDAGERLPLHLHPDARSRSGTSTRAGARPRPGSSSTPCRVRRCTSASRANSRATSFNSSCASRTWTRSSVRCTAFLSPPVTRSSCLPACRT